VPLVAVGTTPAIGCVQAVALVEDQVSVAEARQEITGSRHAWREETGGGGGGLPTEPRQYKFLAGRARH